MITSLFDLDRTVREARGRLARARRALGERTEWEEPPPNPLAAFRSVLGKDTLRELESVPDPLLVPALRQHLAKLILARVLWDDEVRIARAWSEPSARLESQVRLPPLPKEIAPAPGALLLSPRTLLAAVLADPEDPRRTGLANTFASAAREHLRDPTRRHAERRAAAAAQLGVSLDSVDLPAGQAADPKGATSGVGAPGAPVGAMIGAGGSGGSAVMLGGSGAAMLAMGAPGALPAAALGTGVPGAPLAAGLGAGAPVPGGAVPAAAIDVAAAIEAACDELLAATAPIAERFAPWDRGVAATMASGAASGWPAHLQPRWVMSVFAGTELGRAGVIEGARLPPVLGATSFARGLAAFGEAFGEAAGPTSVPFALARPAVDLRPMRLGALFGMLAGEEVFARRTLALGPDSARDHGRAFGRAWCAQARLVAAAVRTRRSLLPPAADLDDRFCEETARAWREPLPPWLAGVLPRIAEDTAARAAATLLAALDRAHMIERFDDDWHRNPRAAEALRAIAAEPQTPVSAELLRKGAAELSRLILAAGGG